jgi:outer membrane protein assembly factor BamA
LRPSYIGPGPAATGGSSGLKRIAPENMINLSTQFAPGLDESNGSDAASSADGKSSGAPKAGPKDVNPSGTIKTATFAGVTIGEIVVVGNKVMNSAVLIALSGHKVGDTCNPEVLSDMQRRLARLGFFGMHHPNDPAGGVRVQSEDLSNNKCKVTITLDENDPVTEITITGSGPIKPEEIRALIHTTVFNAEDIEQDLQRIRDLYYRRFSYPVDFGKNVGMDPAKPGHLIIPIFVRRVADVSVMIDGVRSDDLSLLRGWKTKPGDYYNDAVALFYEMYYRKIATKEFVSVLIEKT